MEDHAAVCTVTSNFIIWETMISEFKLSDKQTDENICRDAALSIGICAQAHRKESIVIFLGTTEWERKRIHWYETKYSGVPVKLAKFIAIHSAIRDLKPLEWNRTFAHITIWLWIKTVRCEVTLEKNLNRKKCLMCSTQFKLVFLFSTRKPSY